MTAQVEFTNRLVTEGRPDEAQEHYETVLSRFRHITAEDDSQILVLRFAQAQSFLRNGYVQHAKKLLLAISQQSERRPGLAHARTLLYLDTLASGCIRSGDLTKADLVLRRLLETRIAIRNKEEDRTTLANASVVVTTYINQDHWADALPLQRLVVHYLRLHHGPADIEMLLSCSLLAITLAESGKFVEARSLLQTITTSFVNTLGREHKETLRIPFCWRS